MRKAFVQLHFAVFLAGFTGVLGRLITLNEGLLVWYRLFISSVTMWIVFSLTKKLQRVSAWDILKLSGIGFLAALHWVSFYGSIKYANVSVALVCFSATGFFTALFEPLFVRKKINPAEVLLGLIVIAGIYVIFHFDPKYKTGIILGVICGILLAIVIYHENKELGWSFFTGLGLIILALCLQMWRVWRQSKFSDVKVIS